MTANSTTAKAKALFRGGLGNRFNELGDGHKAIEFHEQQLIIVRKIGDRYSEANSLTNTGIALITLGEYQKTKEVFPQAFQIADEISYPVVQLEARWGLAQVYLFQNDLENARATIEVALQYDVPENNHNVSALHGIIALRQGDASAARGAFVRTIGQTDEILSKTAEYYSALDAKGLALCGSTVIRDQGLGDQVSGDQERGRDAIIAEAVETFKKARQIAPHAGVVKSVLRLFDELVKCDTDGILKDVRKVVEGVE